MSVTNYYTMNGQIVGGSTGGVRTAYHRDALGSVVATTDENQNVTTMARYAAYGTPFATTGNYSTLRFGWCGAGLPHRSDAKRDVREGEALLDLLCQMDDHRSNWGRKQPLPLLRGQPGSSCGSDRQA